MKVTTLVLKGSACMSPPEIWYAEQREMKSSVLSRHPSVRTTKDFCTSDRMQRVTMTAYSSSMVTAIFDEMRVAQIFVSWRLGTYNADWNAFYNRQWIGFTNFRSMTFVNIQREFRWLPLLMQEQLCKRFQHDDCEHTAQVGLFFIKKARRNTCLQHDD